MTPKPDGFRELGEKHPKDLLTRVKKATKLNLAILSIKTNFHLLTRIRMLNEARDPVTQRKAQSDQYYYYFFNAKVILPTS
jgi:hypothetical protein